MHTIVELDNLDALSFNSVVDSAVFLHEAVSLHEDQVLDAFHRVFSQGYEMRDKIRESAPKTVTFEYTNVEKDVNGNQLRGISICLKDAISIRQPQMNLRGPYQKLATYLYSFDFTQWREYKALQLAAAENINGKMTVTSVACLVSSKYPLSQTYKPYEFRFDFDGKYTSHPEPHSAEFGFDKKKKVFVKKEVPDYIRWV